MASQESSNEGPNPPEPSKRFPTPQQRKRLQKMFDAASKQDSLNKYDYATDLYADCVRGDPGNLEYLQCLVTVLHKKLRQREKARSDGGNSRPAAKRRR